MSGGNVGSLFADDDGPNHSQYRDPEDYRPPPKSALPKAQESGEKRTPSGQSAWQAAMAREAMAEDKAERTEPGWKASAYAQFVEYARRHAEFMTEDIPFDIPEGCDPRALGGIPVRARREKIVESAGIKLGAKFASGKTVWRSLIYQPRP